MNICITTVCVISLITNFSITNNRLVLIFLSTYLILYKVRQTHLTNIDYRLNEHETHFTRLETQIFVRLSYISDEIRIHVVDENGHGFKIAHNGNIKKIYISQMIPPGLEMKLLYRFVIRIFRNLLLTCGIVRFFSTNSYK